MQAREIIEEYRPKEVLKTSPWSTVFLAVDPERGDDVALKLISCGGPIAGDAEIGRFERVVGVVRDLPGTSIPSVRDFGITPDASAFLVMDVVRGADLTQWRTPSPASAISVLLQLVGSLETLAGAGVAHLNLRADNVVVSDLGQTGQVQVLGFGTAAYLHSVAEGLWPDSEAPEVPSDIMVAASAPLTEGWRTDLFSFAVIACRLLGAETIGVSGKHPKVSLRRSVAKEIRKRKTLISMLERALNGDPLARGDSFAGIRDALILALPEEPALPGPVAVVGGEQRSPYETFRIDDGDLPIIGISDEDLTSRVDGPPGLENAGSTLDGDYQMSPSATPFPEMATSTVDEPVSGDLVALAAPDGARESAPDDLEPSRPRTGLVVAGVVVVLAIISMIVAVIGRDEPTRPIESQVAPSPVPTAFPTAAMDLQPPMDPRLKGAQSSLIDGDLVGARALLGELTPERIAAFSTEEAEVFEEIRAALEGADRDRVLRDLRGGLEQGSVRMLRRGVVGISAWSSSELAAVPGLNRDLTRAREALSNHNALWEAEKEGDHLRVIELATKMSALLPQYSGALQAREIAVVAFRADAEAAVEMGDYEVAIARFDSLRSAWPGAPGVEDRIVWCRERLLVERRHRELLEEILARGVAGDPEDGLRRLAEANPDPEWADRYAEAQRHLEDQLAGLDSGFPVIELQDDFELAFKKNQSLVVPLRVSDDYRVERVVVLVLAAGGADYREIQLQNAGDGVYPFEVTPDLHGNAPVRFFVVASDRAGHETRLGGPQGPLTIQKKKWFQK
jgi:serine/threonine protein kinase